MSRVIFTVLFVFAAPAIYANSATYCLRDVQAKLDEAGGEAKKAFDDGKDDANDMTFGEALITKHIQMNHKSVVLKVKF